MVTPSFPAYLAFPSPRLATATDIRRMAALSVLGFKDSEIFRYERPHYDEFPDDALASFVNLYRRQLLDPRAVVIVAEDWLQADDHTGAFLGEHSLLCPEAPVKRVVVGVGSWVVGSSPKARLVPASSSSRMWEIQCQPPTATIAKTDLIFSLKSPKPPNNS